MEPVITITGTALPLDRSDVDTDQIIPSDWLKRVERTGFGQGLFSEWREDPEFVMNLPQFAGANILVAGANFGVGSSREHAVWSIMDYGFAAVIAPRFGDIFRNNSAKNGLVPVVLPADVSERILRAVEAEPTTEIHMGKLNTKMMELSCKSKQALRGIPEGLKAGDLRADMAIDAHDTKMPAF